MCELAFANLDERYHSEQFHSEQFHSKHRHIKVSDAEIKRGGKTYTAHTLKEIHAQNECAQLFFIAGLDAALTIPKWREANVISQLASIVVARRNEAASVTSQTHNLSYSPTSDGLHSCESNIHAKEAKSKLESKFSVIWLNASIPNISSTQVRRAVRAEISLDNLVPKSVEEYIYKHKLYSEEAHSSSMGSSIAALSSNGY